MVRRSLFDKLWKHGAEITVAFPGLAKSIEKNHPGINVKPKQAAADISFNKLTSMPSLFSWVFMRKDVHDSKKMVLNGLPPSIIAMRARESDRVNEYPWRGEAGINVLDSAAYSGMTTIPSIAAEFSDPPASLRGRELRPVIAGSWMHDGRSFKAGARSARYADHSDPDALNLITSVIFKDRDHVMDELVSSSRANEKIDALVTGKLIEMERTIESSDDLDAKTRGKYLEHVRNQMRDVLEQRSSTRFAWKLIESSDPGVSDFAARKWVVSVVEHAEKRLQDGGKRNREVLEKLFEPALDDGKASRAVEGKLSQSSSVALLSSFMASLRARKMGVYCDIFGVLSSSKNPVIRGNAQRTLRDDCSASRF